jgi:hypothetical protein
MFAAGNDRPNLFEIFVADDRFDFGVSIFTRDYNDFADTAGTLKCAYGMRDDGFASYLRKQFIETHAATVTGGNDDGGKHRLEKLKELKSYKVVAARRNSVLTL